MRWLAQTLWFVIGAISGGGILTLILLLVADFVGVDQQHFPTLNWPFIHGFTWGIMGGVAGRAFADAMEIRYGQQD